jgi:hypothetical protein
MTDDLSGGGGGNDKANMMISVNNLNYLLEPDLTVAVNNTHKKHFFNQNEYSQGNSAICILNSGADYVDFRRSYLSFDFEVTRKDSTGGSKLVDTPIHHVSTQATSDFTIERPDTRIEKNPSQSISTDETHSIDIGFGYGSALNLIHRITVTTRSGDEVARIEQSALLSHILTNYCYSAEWQDTIGSLFGLRSKHPNPEDSPEAGREAYLWRNVVRAEQTRCRFHIPMYLLSGFFNYERLMPSMLCSGLRIQIDLNPTEKVFMVSQKVDGLGYRLSNVHIDARSVQLTDSCQRYLNEVSATSGLELVYADYNNSVFQVGVGDSQYEVRQACSRALRAIGRVRNAKQESSIYRDSFSSDYWTNTQYQWRLGSLYFPQQPIKAYNINSFVNDSKIYDFPTRVTNSITVVPDVIGPKSLSNTREAYLQSLEMFGKLAVKNSTSGISYGQFTQGSLPLISGWGGMDYTSTAANSVLPKDPTATSLKEAGVGLVRADEALFAADMWRTSAVPKDVYDEDGEIREGLFNSYLRVSRNPERGFGSISNQISNNAQVVNTSNCHEYPGNHGIIPVLLERSTVFNLSGVPINNSRVLALNMTSVQNFKLGVVAYSSKTDDTDVAKNSAKINNPQNTTIKSGVEVYYPKEDAKRKLDIFLQYVKLARVFLNNVEVEQ